MPTAHLPGNLRLYYEDDNFTDPWAPSETVILHHGNAKNSQLWYAWVPLLAEFRVIRLDARGFGKSSIPEPGYPWSLEGFATDVANLMDYLEIESPCGGRNHRWDHCAAVRLPVPAATPYGHDVYIAV